MRRRFHSFIEVPRGLVINTGSPLESKMLGHWCRRSKQLALRWRRFPFEWLRAFCIIVLRLITLVLTG